MKNRFLAIVLVLFVGSQASCWRGRTVPPPRSEQQAVAADLEAFGRLWLGPARIAPPVIDFEPRAQSDGAVTVTVTPLLPEEAGWNSWSGGGFRLFNNRAALLFEVEVRGVSEVRWIPEGSRLELNVAGNPMRPARVPDELLSPLLGAALIQEQWGLDGDLVERTRAAGPFRGAYLPTAAQPPPMRGVIAFPLDEPDRHIVELRLTLQILDEDGPHFFSWLYD